MTKTSTQAAPELASRTRLAVMRLARRLRQQSLGGDLTPSMLSALAMIEQLEPVALGDLAAAERVRPPTMTRVANRLEGAGLIVRTPAPEDRRVGLLSLTPAGRRHIARSRRRKDAYLAGLLRTLPPADVRRLDEAVAVIERLLEEERD